MATLNSLCILDLLLFTLLLGTDGYFHHRQNECRFSSRDLQDVELIIRYSFNKLEYIRYNSTLNKFIGYTEHGVKNAERWNQDGFAEQTHPYLDSYCRRSAELSFNTILDKSVEPTIKVKSAIHGSHKHTSMLVCSAYDFYPRGIKMTWLRDGVEVTSDVTTTEELANGNWYYQIHSHLEYTPKSGEQISCKVEHASLPKGKEVKWDPTMSEVKRNKVIIGASGLVLGLIITIAGVVYYKKKSTGRILVPSN
ncbi:H-2 class II histocompatibility antigen, E-S beta chain-like [Anguilla anguilla]|uniref:H-2 class II histocompatibility antigen, E-S beta chain-like n=1 Tax=Anguilla anguilla TaxID=7936 RepID=UPI0015AE9B5E|nr:H-2 class II histocompatibility antigen, E-S beta chain-like [Anguilla anguilla]